MDADNSSDPGWDLLATGAQELQRTQWAWLFWGFFLKGAGEMADGNQEEGQATP